ncbi:Schizosaccharomyces specific protein Meu25 [Schizosaccharomyces osmophilus]|uniref:Schizosaccharomyces specific protein Meu25 n=1 Tax=Schizosaccharomyces osmophilus TaxID=2545709 RepID=A0AAF0ASA7_9SCHI|nr:Schizosaccharomyces specific protein Meu25 [Schizosaccharomyces osmophilus]WBW70891.1 Schizosaccharomyces specific protein Meu25 [Schizosaccharomyces osmophilus]
MKNGSGIDNSFSNEEFHLSDGSHSRLNTASSGSADTVVNDKPPTQNLGLSFSDTNLSNPPKSASTESILSQSILSEPSRFFRWVNKISLTLHLGTKNSSASTAESNLAVDSYNEPVGDPAFIPVLKQIGGFDEIRDNLVITDPNFDVKDYDVKFMYLLRKYLLDGPDCGFVFKNEKHMPDGPRVASAKAHAVLSEKLMASKPNSTSPDFGSSQASVHEDSPIEKNEESVKSVLGQQDLKSSNHSVQIQGTNDRLRAVSQLEVICEETAASVERADGSSLFLADSETPHYHLGNESKRKEILDLYTELAKNNDLVAGHTLKDTYFFVFTEDSLLPLERFEYTPKELALFNIQQKAHRWTFRKTQEERLIQWEQLPFKVEDLQHIPFIVEDNTFEQDKTERPYSIRELAYMETRFIALIFPNDLQKRNFEFHRTLARARDFQTPKAREDEIAYETELKQNPSKFLYELDLMESLPANQRRALWAELADFSSKQETDPLLSLWKRQVINCRIGHPKLHTVPISAFFCVKNQPRLIGVRTASATSFFHIDRDYTTYDLRTQTFLRTAPSRSAQNWLLVIHHLEFLGRSFPHLIHLDKYYGFLDYQMDYFRTYTENNLEQPVKSTSNLQEMLMQQV